MPLEIHIDSDKSEVKLISRDGNRMKLSVNNKIYDIDFEKISKGIYSIIHKNRSYNIELVKGKTVRDYNVTTPSQSFEVEIVDAQARYEHARHKAEGLEGVNVISSPMPGKVVRILVNEGDEVEVGQAVITISAMKMESEYKAGVAGIIKKIHVSENEIIEGNQALVVIE